MRKLVSICAMMLFVLVISSATQATTTTITVGTDYTTDEASPRANIGDAPAGFGSDSWQGSETGKVNWHARYLEDGDLLSQLFPDDAETLTISDLASISYYTKRPTGTATGADWWITIYTRTTGTGDASSWYHAKYTCNYSSHTSTDVWTLYSTDTGMTFSGKTLAALIASVGDQLIESITIQTNSLWDGFDGYVDGLTITLTNGNVGQVNFESVPEPATMSLLVIGALALLRKRK